MYQEYVQAYSLEANEMRKEIGLKKRQFNYYIDSVAPADGQQDAFGTITMFTTQFIEGRNTAGLLLIGGVGSGKTFMASSVANSIVNYQIMDSHGYRDLALDIVDTTWIENYDTVTFVSVSEMLENLKDYPYPRTIAKYKECSLLILDDLGAEKATEWSRSKLFELIDYRYNEELPILITSNCIPEELKEHVGARTYDRIRSMCALVPVKANSQRITANI